MDNFTHTQDSSKDKSRVHYREFHNIFLYITERCQLRCGHCYMGDRLERGLSFSFEDIKRIMVSCRKLGSEYITFLGGEPTLHPNLSEIIDYAHELGYKQVMMDSNGLSYSRIRIIQPEKLYYTTISLDGATEFSHDKVRGKGTFAKTINTIKKLVRNGYRVRINCTIFNFNVYEAPLLLEIADEIGVSLVNFHTFSEEGYGIGNLDWSLSPNDWIDFYEKLERVKGQYKTSIWYPPTWATHEKIGKYVSEGFRGCLGCSLDRLSIFPDGRCYVCSVLFDKSVHFATITDNGLILNRENNEFEMFTAAAFQAKEAHLMGCPAEKILEEQGKIKTHQDLIPMCRCWKSQV
jgi:MoaA/NifB/PqqE/SkfB family radical SAM enzyme